MNRLHFIGYAPQSDGVSVPMYAPAEAFPVCECGVNVCLGQCCAGGHSIFRHDATAQSAQGGDA